MSDRFFSSQPITSDRAMLDGPEAHHLLHVMRASIGDEITLFDGSGAEFTAVVEKLGRSDVQLRVAERREVNRELPFELVIGVALPKGDRQKWLVEKLTELGATALVPLSTERGVAQPTASAIERLERSVIEAAKQCGRNRLMRVKAAQSWDSWVSSAHFAGDRPLSEHSAAPCRLVAHPHGVPLASVDLRARSPIQIAVGPEGGLTDAELATAAGAGWRQVDLGPRILRVETAAIALAAAVGACQS